MNRWTDKTKLIVTFCNFANMPKNACGAGDTSSDKLINHKTRRQSSASILLSSGVEKVKAKYHLQMK